jgi:hypothetical protein
VRRSSRRLRAGSRGVGTSCRCPVLAGGAAERSSFRARRGLLSPDLAPTVAESRAPAARKAGLCGGEQPIAGSRGPSSSSASTMSMQTASVASSAARNGCLISSTPSGGSGPASPRKKLFVVMDNLHNIHDHPRFLAVLRQLRIHPVFTPTEASWLNLIKAHFGVLRRFTLSNTDDLEHVLRRRRVYRWLQYRHKKLDRLAHPLNRLRTIGPVKLEQH